MSSTAAADDSLPPFMGRLAGLPGIVLFWTLHGLLFVLLLPELTPTIAHVDANSADILQRTFALAYQFKNPPLYEWLELAVQAAIGPGPRSFLVVRYTLMGLMGVVLHRIVARASGSNGQAAAASLGLMSFYWFAWYFHDSISHSILVALACLVFLSLVLEWLRRPALPLALLIGLSIGFGFLAKYNFAVLLTGTAIALATDPATRGRLLDRRLVVALAVAAAMVAPVLLAGAALGKSVAAVVVDQVIDREAHWLWARLRGGGLLLVHYLLFLLPWALFAWVILRGGAGAPARPPADPAGERFLRRLAIVTAVVVFLVVVAVGARSVSERYLFPVLLAVPVYVHIAWGRRVSPARQLKGFGAIALAVLVLVVLVRLFNVATATWSGRDNKRYDPYEDLAAVLVDRGLGAAYLVASDRYEAGNLLAFMPDVHAAGLATQRRWLPRSYPSDGRCLLFFRGRFEETGPRDEPVVVPANVRPLLPAGAVIDTVRVPWRATLVGPARVGVFHLVDLGTDAAACRAVFGPVSPGAGGVPPPG